MGHERKFTILMVFVATFSIFALRNYAQDDDNQSWNDMVVSIPLSKKIDFTITGTLRLGKNVSTIAEARVGPGLLFKVSKTFSFSPSYLYLQARNAAGVFHHEHRFNLKANYKFPTKGFGLSHRSLFEYRVRTSGNTWRYRPSLTFEKSFPKRFLKDTRFFVMEEPFFVSTIGKFSRNEFSVGISRTVSKRLTVDIFYLRLNDGYIHPGDFNVIGTAWKVRLH